MYSQELSDYISFHNNSLTPDEYSYISNRYMHPQIDHIRYNPYDDVITMWTSDKWQFDFKVKEFIRY